MKRQFERSTVSGEARAFSLCLSILALFLVMPGTLRGAPAPPNDTCIGAELVPGEGPFPHLTAIIDLSGATTNASDPFSRADLAPNLTRSVWYRFTPRVTALYTLSTCSDDAEDPAATTVFDTVLGLYTSAGGCNGPFFSQGLADQTCGPEGFQASLTTQLLADTTYYVVVWKYCDQPAFCEDGLNTLQLKISGTVVPVNDTCFGALPLQVNLPAIGTTVGAANNFQISGTGAFSGIDQIPSQARGRDVVYSFLPPAAGDYSFRVSGYRVNQNLVLYVVPSCPGGTGPTDITGGLGAANRSQVNSVEEVMCLPLTAGQEVFVIVDDNDLGNPGSSFTLEVTACVREIEPNNSPAEAFPFSNGIEGSTVPQFDMDFLALGRFPRGWRAFALLDGEACRTANFDLRITTLTDTLEYDDDDNDGSFGDSSPNIAGTPLTGEPAFAFINFFGGAEREPYRFFAVVQPPLASAVPETEPNGILSQANSADPNYFYGTLAGASPSTDVDVYAFGVAEQDLIFLSLDGDPHRTNAPLNARLELLDQTGKLLVGVNDNGATSFGSTNVATNTLSSFGPSSPGEALVYRSGVEGVFYARVSASANAVGGSGAGRYLLSISKNGFAGADGVNHPPAFNDVTLSSPPTAGTPVALTGTLWEPDTGDALSLVVSWGDGTTNIINYPTPGRLDFSIPHQFETGNTNLTIRLAVTDKHGASATLVVPTLVRAAVPRFQAIDRLQNGRIHLRLVGSPYSTYRIEHCSTLGVPWVELGKRTSDAAGLFTIDDLSPAPDSRFYRAIAVP